MHCKMPWLYSTIAFLTEEEKFKKEEEPTSSIREPSCQKHHAGDKLELVEVVHTGANNHKSECNKDRKERCVDNSVTFRFNPK